MRTTSGSVFREMLETSRLFHFVGLGMDELSGGATLVPRSSARCKVGHSECRELVEETPQAPTPSEDSGAVLGVSGQALRAICWADVVARSMRVARPIVSCSQSKRQTYSSDSVSGSGF